MTDALTFLKKVDAPSLATMDRALAILWHDGKTGGGGVGTGEICRVIEQAGHPGQNVSRLSAKLSAQRNLVSRVPGKNAWRLHPRAQTDLDNRFGPFLKIGHVPVETDSVLPNALFKRTRGYIEKVVLQINASFDTSLFDCCAVMCRRLLETLIIEVYETAGRAAEIKGKDGNFLMFSDLQRILLSDGTFHLSRNTQQGLRDFKKLGDLSAHSRRYNAQASDIERVRLGVRVASEELLHLAKLI